MKNVVRMFWPGGIDYIVPSATVRDPDDWCGALAGLYYKLICYCLREGSLAGYQQIGRCCCYEADDGVSEDTWALEDFAATRKCSKACGGYLREHYEIGAFIMRTRPEVVEFINSRWEYDGFVACCDEINSESCMI